MQLAPAMVAKLEALSESDQETILNYINSGARVGDAYKRVAAGQKPAAVEPEGNGADQARDSAANAEIAAPAPGAANTAKTPKTKKEAGPKKLSAIDAAAKVLAEDGGALNCQEMIDAMAAKGYRTSPGGKTPRSDSLLRDSQGDNHQGERLAVQEDGAR